MTYDTELIRKRNALIMRWHDNGNGLGYRRIADRLVEAGYERIRWETVRDVVKREKVR